MEFQERSLTGPVMKTDDFDLSFAMRLRKLVEKHNIKYDPNVLIVHDKTADAVFHAGVELLADIGLYHLGTQRVIKFTKQEIYELAEERKNNPGKATFGLGEDEMTIEFRSGGDKRPPLLYAGMGGALSEEDFEIRIQSFAQEKAVKGMGISGGIEKVGNIEPRAGTLSEVYCAMWEQNKLMEVLHRVGRPGMNLGLLCTASTLGAIMHCIKPGLREPHNTQIGVHVIPEQKIDWDRLMLSHFCQDRGIVPWQSAMSLLGGLCRDAADTSVALIANMLGQMSFANGPMCSLFPTNRDGTWADRGANWAACTALRASERNIRVATGGVCIGDMNWGRTEIGLLQEALKALLFTASGVSYAWLAGACGIAARMIGEIMNAAASMEKEKLITISENIMEEIERLKPVTEPFVGTPRGSDIYDIKTITPKPEYLKLLDNGRNRLTRLGVLLEH